VLVACKPDERGKNDVRSQDDGVVDEKPVLITTAQCAGGKELEAVIALCAAGPFATPSGSTLEVHVLEPDLAQLSGDNVDDLHRVPDDRRPVERRGRSIDAKHSVRFVGLVVDANQACGHVSLPWPAKS